LRDVEAINTTIVIPGRANGSAPSGASGNDDRENFSFGFNLIWVVQDLQKKYSRSHLTQITSISAAIPAHTKGRFAIVTDVGAGCGGREVRT
jgi:hypothetical protein